MVGRGDRDRVDRRVVEHATKIPLPLGRKRGIARLLRQVGERAVEHGLIRIDDGGDFHAGNLGETGEVLPAAAVHPEYGDADAVIGPGDRPRRARAEQEEGTRGAGGRKEPPTRMS